MADNELNNDFENENQSEKSENKGKRSLKLILIFIAVFVLIFATITVVTQLYNKYNETPHDTETTQQTTSATDEKVENPIDFASLQAENDEIYAWIKIDDTNVDYPIVQSKTNDEFYLRHKAEDKSYSASGAIYTELANATDFNDFVTVIYGHNGYSDTMFTTLHYFEDEEFFDNHPYFYIYTPTSRLTYQIISAFKYDNRHILNSFDFGKEDVIEEFQEMISNPSSTVKNVRSDLDTELEISSKIVVLSTCITNQKSSRYLVCGVLVKNEETY